MHFLSLRGTPTRLPVSIASEYEDKCSFARIFRYLLLHYMRKYGVSSKFKLNYLKKVNEVLFLISSLRPTRKLSNSLLLNNGQNNVILTELGKYHTSAKPFLEVDLQPFLSRA